VKHFLVIDVIVSCLLISSYVKFIEIFPTWWPLFAIDTPLRVYFTFCTYALYLKFKSNQIKTEVKESSEKSSQKSLTVEKAPRKVVECGVLSIFDSFLGIASLEVSAYLYVAANIGCSIFALVYLLFIDPDEALNEEDILIYIIAFMINIAMLLNLLVAMKMVSLF
jgi:hypothetical protein